MEELDRKRYEAGMKMRRSVLGDAWVDKATNARTEFTKDWQEYITRYAWGEVWTRPGIDRRTRSHMTLALMIALGRWEEFNLHVVAAFNNGLNEDDIKEIIMHAACYCGVPAGNNAFAEASATLAKMGDSLASHAPLNRLGDDEDLKGLCVLLASDAGKHITGQWMAVDGGVSIITGG